MGSKKACVQSFLRSKPKLVRSKIDNLYVHIRLSRVQKNLCLEFCVIKVAYV